MDAENDKNWARTGQLRRFLNERGAFLWLVEGIICLGIAPGRAKLVVRSI